MILIVGDEGGTSTLRQVLEDAGYLVHFKPTATAALTFLSSTCPALIISGILIPEMDGISLCKTVARHFPDRMVPFVFLSSLSDTTTIVRALDSGGDDFLITPVDPALLLAKVRAVLRQRAERSHVVFRGDLSRLSLSAVLKFCESKALTGHVLVTCPDITSTIRFHAGLMDQKDPLSFVNDPGKTTQGTFTIYSNELDCTDIENARLSQGEAPPPARISSICRNGRVLHIQTELLMEAANAAITVVSAGGRTLWKKITPIDSSCPPSRLCLILDRQHECVETRLRARLNEALRELHRTSENSGQTLNRLIDQGDDRIRQRDYAGALAIWQKALSLAPSNKVLELNVRIAQHKLNALKEN